MKNSLIFKVGFILLISMFLGFQKGHAITIYGYGYYTIYDPNYVNSTFDVYVFVETSQAQFPCNSNPIASGISQGNNIPSGVLTFFNVYPPVPAPVYPYRIVIAVHRTNNGSEWRFGYSDWSTDTGFSPWSPSNIKVQEF